MPLCRNSGLLMQNRVSQLENHVPDSGNTGNGGSGETGDDYADQIAAMQKELADLKSAVQSSRDMYSKLESNMAGLQEMLYQHDSNLNEVRDRLESYEAFMAEFNDFKAWVQQGTEKMAMEAYQKTVSGHWLMDLTLLHHHTQPPVLFRDMGLTGIVV